MVGVAARRSGDEEDQVRRAVLGAEVGRRDSRANARVGTSTAVERQCGIAMPPGRPVAEVASRASASSASRSGVRGAAGVGDRAASARITSVLSLPRDDVEADERRGDHLSDASVIVPQFSCGSRGGCGRGELADLDEVGVGCDGVGMVVPGRPAAALP